jgi:alkylation response protein AidB-like acyl-CoA dehydrogenase
LERAINYGSLDSLSGLSNYPVQVAEMATLVETAGRSPTKRHVSDRGIPNTQLSAMAKWWSCQAAVKVVDEALQLHGGYGYIGDYAIERFYRAAKLLELYEGTKEIQKMAIGRRVLGMG